MIPRALTIAGSDSSGGAGIQADLKTFTVHRVYGMTAITALTAQNTRGVAAIHAVPADFVRRQIDAVVTDVGVDAVKTGMLANAEIIAAVCAALRDHDLRNVVVDPVFVAQSGAPLIEAHAQKVLLDELVPLARVVTPNLPEAAKLTGFAIESVADMRRAAAWLVDRGARSCLVKGGHLGGAQAIDVFWDGRDCVELAEERTATPHTHGTGCQLSAAITANLARGLPLAEAVARAKQFITVAIRHGLAIGAGDGPANPLAWLDR